MRDLSEAQQSAIASSNVALALFVEMDFGSGFLRVTNAPHNISWNGETWIGLGTLGGIDVISEGASLEARGVALKLSGVPVDGEGASENIAIALNEHYQGRPCRIWVAPLGGTGNSYLKLPGAYGSPLITGNTASTPHSPSLAITGDIDVRIKAAPSDWTPSSGKRLITKWNPGQRSWSFHINGGGLLAAAWSNDGTSSVGHTSTAFLSVSDLETAFVRWTLDVNDGFSPTTHSSRFWQSVDEGFTWTQIGATVTSNGATSIFNSTTAIVIGELDGGHLDNFVGNVYYAEVRNGIDGTIVARFDAARDDLSGLQTWTINKNGPDYARIIRDPFMVLADPRPIFEGRMDNMEIVVGKTAEIVLHVESRLADLERPRIRRYNDADQRVLYPDDRGLEFVEQMVEKSIPWGRL